MSDFKLTREQLIAGSHDRNMAVNANAGSGKTSVLVSRFTDILLSSFKNDKIETGFIRSDIKPGEIVAITFTRKAAMEMVSKITRKIEDKIKEETDSEKLKFLRYIREKLTNARISTIHSFCSELLRSFPTEADVSPAFFEMPAPELLEIRQDAVQTILEEMLESNNETANSMVNDLFKSLERRATTEILTHLVSNEELMLALENFYRQSDSEITIELNKIILSEFADFVLGMQKIMPILAAIDVNCLPARSQGQFSGLMREINNLTPKIASDYFEINDILLLCPLIFSLITTLYTLKGTPRNAFIKDSQSEYTLLLNIYDSHFQKLQKFQQAVENYNLENHLLAIGRNLLYVAGQALELVRQEKARIDGLDFDDLMILTAKLLDNNTVADTVRKKIKFLLVDEFQDTNDLQYEIIKKIVPDLTFENFDSGVNLFIVGDEKQSIYGFRRADVRVFNKARADIAKRNADLRKSGQLPDFIWHGTTKIVDVNDKELNGNASLTSTFRLQPVIASFVNRLCGNLMNESAKSNIQYSNLVCAKNAEYIFENFNLTTEQAIKNFPAGSVSMLLSQNVAKNDDNDDYDDGSDAEEASQSESELLAKYLKFIVESDSALTVFEDGTYRKAEYSDIAVLSRTKKFDKLISSLLEHKIPYILHSGSGFYDSQIIRDLISYLGFLTNPDDDLSLFGVLISPFFRISEEEILVVQNSKNNTSLWLKVGDIVGSGAGTYELKRAHNTLKHLKDLSGCLSISQNILSYIQHTGWYSVAAGEPDFTQQEANINKFLETAREFDSRGFHSIHDFEVHLNFINDSDTSESEAITISDKNAVNLLTIHASKGLEFPVVVLFNTNHKTKRQRNYFTDPEFGITTKVPFKSNKTWSKVETPRHYFASANSELKDYEEEKRVLYVATTRAKDHLIISAALKPTKEGYGKTTGLFKMIQDGLELSDTSDLMQNDNYYFHDNLSVLLNNEIKSVDLLYPLRIISSIPYFETSEAKKSFEIGEVKILDSELQAGIFNETFSATKIMTFKNPDEFIKKYLLGFRDDWISSEKEVHYDEFVKDPESGDLPATEKGTIIHYLLEKAPLWVQKSSKTDSFQVSDILQAYLDDNNIYLTGDEEKKQLITEAEKTVSSKLFKDRFNSIMNGFKECELTIPVDEDILVAKIDLLLKDETGNFEIWDWKTNHISNENDRKLLIEKYKPQMLLYAYMVSLKYPGQMTVKARLLFTKLAGPDAADTDWTSVFTWTEDELKTYGSELRSLIKKMKTLDELKKND